MIACTDEPTTIPVDQANLKTEIVVVDETLPEAQGEVTILGDRIKIAHTVSNMQASYTILKSKKGSIIPTINITTTYWYIRFLPKNETELKALKRDSTLELFDFPLEYEVLKLGNYYHDPSIPSSSPTYYYSVVKVGFSNISGLPYEKLADLYFPNLEVKDAGKANPEEFDDAMSMLECEAMLRSGNITTDEYTKAMADNTKGRKKPKGYIKVKNTVTGLDEGVKGIKVRVFSGCRYECKTTNSDGYYEMSNKYLFKLWYAVKGENNIGFKLWDHIINIDEAVYQMGYHSPSGHDFTAATNSEAWEWFTANNAVVDYFKYCDTYSISKPPSDLRLMILQENNYGDNECQGSASMFRRIWYLKCFNTSAKVYALFLIMNKLQLTASAFEIITKFNQPDITIQLNRNKVGTPALYETVFHECAHASHWKKVGNDFWITYINYIIENGAYGNGTGTNYGLVAISETWGFHMGWFLAQQKFGSNAEVSVSASENFVPGERGGIDYGYIWDETTEDYQFTGWIPMGIIHDLVDLEVDNVNGVIYDNAGAFSHQEIFNALDSDVRSPQQFRDRLLTETSNRDKADVILLFNAYNYN